MTAPLPRILLIEPQFVLRRTITMVARDLGLVDFQEASNVGRARALLAGEAYAGLVLDLGEEAQALELLRELRQSKFSTAPDAPVVVVVAASDKPASSAPLQALGVSHVLVKPVRISDLLSAIAQVQQPSEA